MGWGCISAKFSQQSEVEDVPMLYAQTDYQKNELGSPWGGLKQSIPQSQTEGR